MDFVTLYGPELDRELGTADRTQRFTTQRRKDATNAAQLEWVKRTECLVKETTIPLVDNTQTYDLEATISDFGWIAKQGVSIKIVDASSNVRYLEGDDLQITTEERLNVEEPGWRAVSKGTPTHVYLKRDGGAVNLGLHPKPAISGETWTAILPYVVIPADMAADADEPFTVSANILRSMRPWHRALVHFAAYDLEKLRKDTARGAAQLQLFEAEVQKFTGKEKPKGGQSVRFSRVYRNVRNARIAWDPRT